MLSIELPTSLEHLPMMTPSLGQNATLKPPPASRDDFRIAIICALNEEFKTVGKLMTRDYRDEKRSYAKADNDVNSYMLGELGGKPVVLVAPGGMGSINTRDVANNLKNSYKNIKLVFVVGITGGAPFEYHDGGLIDSDIHLGDVIVSTGVIEYDFGREYENGFRRKKETADSLPRAPAEVQRFINLIQGGTSGPLKRIERETNRSLAIFDTESSNEGGIWAQPEEGRDHVYASGYRHKHQQAAACEKCAQCTAWHHEVCERALVADCQELGCLPVRTNSVRKTKIHFGRYASGNAVMKSGRRRDRLIEEDKVIGFEMEGAGAWEIFSTIIVKGVTDYADSHKNKQWRMYPAARAALCATAMIEEIDLADEPQASK